MVALLLNSHYQSVVPCCVLASFPSDSLAKNESFQVSGVKNILDSLGELSEEPWAPAALNTTGSGPPSAGPGCSIPEEVVGGHEATHENVFNQNGERTMSRE